MATRGQVWSSADGKFGISHTADEEPKAYEFATKEEAETERDRRFNKSEQIERTCAGGGLKASRTATHLQYAE